MTGTARSMRAAGAAAALVVAGGIALLASAPTGHAQPRDPADPGATLPGRTEPSFEPPRGPRGIPDRIDPALRFTGRERSQFETWVREEYGRGKCPQGLVKREGSCFPRGQRGKRYTVGTRLQASVVPAPVPLDLTRRVGTPPIGYRYGVVDGDLLKIATDTGLVVDALDGYLPK